MKYLSIMLTLLSSSICFAHRDLETGTFLPRDPIGYSDGQSVYCHVNCNPICAVYEAYETRPVEWSDGTTGNPDRQRANTKNEEAELGLLNEGMRYRDLETGTFLTRDPIGYADGPNVYCYVHSNPITSFDPLGLCGGYNAGYGAYTPIQQKNMEMARENDPIVAGVLTATALTGGGALLAYEAAGTAGVTVYVAEETFDWVAGSEDPAAPFFIPDPTDHLQVWIQSKLRNLDFMAGVQDLESVAVRRADDAIEEISEAVPVVRVDKAKHKGKAPEIESGTLTESEFIDSAGTYLGEGYAEVSPGRYQSATGETQVRYGAHETRKADNHHGHFEALEEDTVTETATVEIVPDPPVAE